MNVTLLAATGVPWFAVLLLVSFYALVALEFFLPTGGLAGFGAVAAIVSAVVISLEYNIYWSVGILAVTILTTPPLIVLLIRVWPTTIIGRRILNARDSDPPYVAPETATRRGRPLQSLVGIAGTAVSDLLPSGLVRIDGERIDAFTTGQPINRGDRIVAVGIENRRLQVRLAGANENRTGTTSDTKPEIGSAEFIQPTSTATPEFDLDELSPET